MTCSYRVLGELAPESQWSDESTYLDRAAIDWYGTPRINRWELDQFPLAVYFERVPSWPRVRMQAAESRVLEAFGFWDDAIAPGLPSFRVVESLREANLVVRWTPVALEENADLRGSAQSMIDSSLHVRQTEIWLLEQYVEEDTPRILQQVGAHELGHALGLRGHSPSTDDLMYPSLEGAPRPSARDRATLRGLYLCRSKTPWVDEP